ncbi:MAG: hypothetical protein RBR15_10020 [Sphaerochaeta sp.]|nr:hypothetical protein [Sphaerochaeta sp.]
MLQGRVEMSVGDQEIRRKCRKERYKLRKIKAEYITAQKSETQKK